jgi:MFS family permease
VGVALPAIRHALGFLQASLAWVVNPYLLVYGGFLLLGGRLGDLFGHPRLFAAAIGIPPLALEDQQPAAPNQHRFGAGRDISLATLGGQWLAHDPHAQGRQRGSRRNWRRGG